MNIFEKLFKYGANWSVIGSRLFDDEEKAAVKSAQVVSSEFGKSVCFYMHSGGQTYIPLSTQSKLEVGDDVDMETAKILTLRRDGSDDINRIDA